jgi:hypothetical protein
MGRTRSVAQVSEIELRRLWATDMSRCEIATALKISGSSLGRLIRLHNLPAKPHLSKNRRPEDPDEHTISILTGVIRARWSKKQEKSRRVNKAKLPLIATSAQPV